jgi:hypothetical protein
MPDLYGYDYGRKVIRAPATASEPPVFRCSASETTPLPTAAPQVVWRAGLDLSPIDASDPSQVAWLETLVWPEQTARLANLRAAVKIAATVKPRAAKGDLRGNDLVRLCSEAPKDATLVIFTRPSSTISPIPPTERLSLSRRCISRRIGYRTNSLAYSRPSTRTKEQAGRPGAPRAEIRARPRRNGSEDPRARIALRPRQPGSTDHPAPDRPPPLVPVAGVGCPRPGSRLSHRQRRYCRSPPSGQKLAFSADRTASAPFMAVRSTPLNC